jgi:SAM-dependent methyltransferase
MKNISIFRSREQEFRLLETYITQKATDGHPLKILEAGCGRRWPLDLGGIQYTLTGIDLDKDALDLRKSKFDDLDETIIGDLRSIDLGENQYDVIYNSFVLEHVENARRVLDNFYNWLKPGGILILRIPDRNSVYGLVTRLTPFWLHVYYRKYISRFPNAGKPGFGPYPTFYDLVVSRAGIHEFCRDKGLLIKEEYGQGDYLGGRGLFPVFTKMFARGLSLLSLGSLPWKHNNLTYVLEKEA